MNHLEEEMTTEKEEHRVTSTQFKYLATDLQREILKFEDCFYHEGNIIISYESVLEREKMKSN